MGALDNYPSNNWNCTVYRPDTDSKQDTIKDLCEIDDFIVGLCHDENIDGICMIASYIKDLCQQADKEYRDGEEDEITENEEIEGVEDMTEEVDEINEVANSNDFDDEDLGLVYSSPWGKKSQCMTPFYQKLCSNDAIKSCYDCRTSVLSATPKKSYYYHCHTVSSNEDEVISLKWLGEKNYECAKMINHNIDSKQVDVKTINYESPWGLQSECNQNFYKQICTHELAQSCFDCRKFLGKELFTRKPQYSYSCSPLYKGQDKKEAQAWLDKEKYECKMWYNPNFKPSSFRVTNLETKQVL